MYLELILMVILIWAYLLVNLQKERKCMLFLVIFWGMEALNL